VKFIHYSFIPLAIVLAYLFGLNQNKAPASVQEYQRYNPTREEPTLTPVPTQVPQPQVRAVNVQQNTPTFIRLPERKRVSVQLDDGGFVKGNYYCYEDKVNELTYLQNDILNYETIANMCNFTRRNNASVCSEGCSATHDYTTIGGCIDSCYDNATPNCDEQNTKVGDFRKTMYNKTREYCQ
jgi:hypothetical protein